MSPRWDRFVLPALLVIAALLRLPGLAGRGTWDGDQGHDMLVLRSMVQDGLIPVLGPPTSIGDVHHGAWYYYVMGPAAALTGGDSPLAVVAVIALMGVAAVGVVWWLARAIGGPVAGLAAGLVMALSTAAVDESTFIWNPNIIALSSAVALAAAWWAWSCGHRAWWLVAAVGTALTMQGHVLGVALLPVIGVPFILDARRRPLGRIGLGVAAIFAVAYLPLLVHEATTGGGEVRAALDYLAGGRDPGEVALPVRFGIVALRVVSWPLTGLITDGFVAGAVAALGTVAVVAWRWRVAAAGSAERNAVRWLGLGLLWTVAVLTVAAPSLAVVVPGLPNDHYHAFADPMVFVLLGLGVAAVVRSIPRPGGALLGAAVLVAVLGWNVANLPPPVHADGGFPAAAQAAERIDAALTRAGIARTAVVRLRSLPDFKSTEAVVYPLARLGRRYVGEVPAGVAPGGVAPGSVDAASVEAAGGIAGLVLLCDDLFRATIGAPCGGPAEASVTPDAGGQAWGPLLERLAVAPGRFVSVYGRAGG